MRIIAGEFRHRVLLTPADAETTRPIPDRVKESLFAMLRGHCEGANVFDGFAGTGAIGLEAISRGAAHCVLVERDRHVGELLKKNVDSLDVRDRCDVVIGDALGAGGIARASRPLTLAFLDPPYPLVQDAVGFRRVMAQMKALVELLSNDGFAVLRTPWPLQHRVGEEPLATDEPQPRHYKKKGKERAKWRQDLQRRGVDGPAKTDAKRTPRVEKMREEEVEWLDLDDQGRLIDSEGKVVEDETLEAEGGEPNIEFVPADMSLPNAKGPETHVFRGMAIHLYMRARSAEGNDGNVADASGGARGEEAEPTT